MVNMILKRCASFICIFLLPFVLCNINAGIFKEKPHHDLVDVSNSNASFQTIALMHNLKINATENIMFGHQDAVAYGIGYEDEPNGWDAEEDGYDFRSDVNDVCGSYPAVFGWDLGHIEGTHNIDSVSFELMKYWILEVYEQGGINTVSWHEKNPVTGGSTWDTSETIEHIMPGGDYHEYFKTLLDKVADFFLSLETDDGYLVPIVFRPYHEHNGWWFWWGTSHSTNEEFIELWQFTHNYLTIEKECTNLLFAYSPDIFMTKGEEEYLFRYPGDDYVDILGFDNYWNFTSPEGVQLAVEQIRIVVGLADEKDKVAALTETGYETVPVDDWWTQYLLNPIKEDTIARNIAWALVWRNENWNDNGIFTHFYGPHPGHPSVPDFLVFHDNPFTAFLDDLPDMYNIKIVDKPQFFPDPDEIYTSAINVEIVTDTDNATIEYRTSEDGGNTWSDTLVYTEPVEISEESVVKFEAWAIKDNWITSKKVATEYTVTGVVSKPVFSPDPNLIYTEPLSVKITTETENAAIKYIKSEDGGANWSDTLYYYNPINLTESSEVMFEAWALKENWKTSDISTALYTVDAVVIDEKHMAELKVKAWINNNMLYIKSNKPFIHGSYISLYSLTGSLVYQTKILPEKLQTFNISLNQGVYILRVICKEKPVAIKIYIN